MELDSFRELPKLGGNLTALLIRTLTLLPGSNSRRLLKITMFLLA
jgi:hypothetical protein